MLPKLGRGLLMVLTGVYLFALYHLLVIPAVLDWSIYGIILLLILTVLLYLSFPRGRRFAPVLLGTGFLFLVRAFYATQQLGLAHRLVAVVVITGIAWFALYFLGVRSWRRYAVLALTALVLTMVTNPQNIKFWPEFKVAWASSVLYNGSNVSGFPVYVADVDHDGKDEIITEGIPGQKSQIAKPVNNLLAGEKTSYLALNWDRGAFKISPYPAAQQRLLADLAGHNPVNFPYYQSSWISGSSGIDHLLNPLVNRQTLVDRMTDFGAAPLQALSLSIRSLGETRSNLDQMSSSSGGQPGPSLAAETPVGLKVTWKGQTFTIPGKSNKLVGLGFFRDRQHTGFLVLGTRLELWEPTANGSVTRINSLTGDQVPGIPYSRVIIADLNHDGLNEILLSADRSRILALNPDGRWRNLWVARDDSFHFEDYAPLSGNNGEIIALTRSVVRHDNSRFLTGLSWNGSKLQTDWKVFIGGLVNVRAGDFDGNGKNEFVAAAYQNHRIFVLIKHHLPVVPILYLITAGLIVFNFFRSRRLAPAGEVSKHV